MITGMYTAGLFGHGPIAIDAEPLKLMLFT
jgi:hypothetical protein